MRNFLIISVLSKRFSLLLFAFIIGSMQLTAQPVNGEIIADTGNITVIKLWGTSYERGFAYGYLLGDRIIELYEGYTMLLFGDYWPDVMSIIVQGDAFQIDSAYWEEAEALMDGITAAGYNSGGYTSLDVIAGNCTYDFASWPFGKRGLAHHCSTFINWNEATTGTDLDGKSVIARHGDEYPDSLLTANFVIVIHIPSEENLQPWLHMGYAGEMASTANLNSSGYFISSNAMVGLGQLWSPDTAAGYEPQVFTMRKAMETIDYNQDGINNLLDIKDIISSNQNGYSDGSIFTFMGPSTAVQDSMIAMIAEVAPDVPFLTFRTNGYLDSIPGDNLYAANNQIARNNAMKFCSRYQNMINHIGSGTNIGTQENWDLMRDYSNSGSYNLYFLQFIPEWDQLKICVYQNNTAAYLNDPVTFDLSEFWIPPAGISSMENQIQNIFYPNPAQHEITVRNIEKLSGDIIIYSLSGQEVLRVRPLSESINISNILPGMYILEVEVKGRKLRQKLIVE